MGVRTTFAAAALVGLALFVSSAPEPTHASDRSTARGSEIIGAFLAAGPISGAELLDGYLYVATSGSLSIYDVERPQEPQLVGFSLSPHFIYGELISTNGETLLLNDGLSGGTVDVWNVEDKTNPVFVSTLNGINDEHVSCLLECTWAYGSNGSIIDLRDRSAPKRRGENWMEIAALGDDRLHRLDEYRNGFMATAPLQGRPAIVDARRPLHPHLMARTKVPKRAPSVFLYSEWARAGRDRFIITSTEFSSCDERRQGALVSFDTRGWPQDRRFEVAGTFKYRGRSDDDDDQCTAYYFSRHPRFRDGGLILLPNGLEGTRIVEVDPDGKMKEIDSFIPPISNVWFAFWADEEIYYALNITGEVYILRYS